MIGKRGKGSSAELNKEVYIQQIMERYGTMLKGYAYTMLQDEYLAEDATQRTFVNFYYHLDRFRHDCSEKNYLFQIMRNEIKQFKRRAWFRRESRQNYADLKAVSVDSGEKTIDKMVIANYIHSLKPKYQEVILLYYYQQFTVAEISQILGISVSATKSRLKYGRDQLKKDLQEVFEDENRG